MSKQEAPRELVELEAFLLELRQNLASHAPWSERELFEVVHGKSTKLAEFHAFIRGMIHGL